jgi:hypothetical protein
VKVSFASEDAPLASAAGVTPAGITVNIQRKGSTEATRTAVAGADGIAQFTGLLEGTYSVSADRPLSSAEISRLPADQREASLFAGGAQVTIAPPETQTAVQLVASRRGSLVISEVFDYQGRPPLFYAWGTYVEVYNNADTTVYLDGMLYFRTQPQMHRNFDNVGGCSGTAEKRLDPAGVWATQIWAFPGTGRDFPVKPGQAKVLAMDAINHDAASPGNNMPDLSKADFEQIGTDADVNNPAAADMIRVQVGTGFLGRGYPLQASQATGLALASARNRLVVGDWYGSEIRRIPADAILDVAGFEDTPEAEARLAALGAVAADCSPWLTPTFERAPAALVDYEAPTAIARRSLGFTPDGREILQRTGTSARDFVYADPLRRSLLKP